MTNFKNLFKSKLTVDFLTKYLRGKGLAVKELDSDWWMVKVYDYHICYRYVDDKLVFSTTLNACLDDINIDILSRACNLLNDNMFAMKNYWTYEYNDDSENREPVGLIIHFAFEQICTAERDIISAYELYLPYLLDAIEKSKQAYNYYNDQLNNQVNNTIGFNYNSGNTTNDNAEKIESKGRIGFK